MYIYDVMMESSSNIDISKFKEILNAEFEMKDLGEAIRILGMNITRNFKRSELFLSKSSYLKKVGE